MGKHGFTLLELSIVLVVIGLVVGGIVAGRELIAQGEIRSITNDLEKYRAAMYTFKLKYRALPGDFANAKAYWPNPLCTDDGSNTCNGNGNGFLQAGVSAWEDLRSWEHLALAGIIPGSYTGKIHGTSREEPRVNVPYSPRGGYRVMSNGLYRTTKNRIRLSDGIGTGGVISVSEAVSIDLKLDDGLASTGKIVSWDIPATANLCVDGDVNTVAVANYIMSTTAPNVCRLAIEF
jgi:prepilin-type N-terminal cleavage/methylation domain-containing protein